MGNEMARAINNLSAHASHMRGSPLGSMSHRMVAQSSSKKVTMREMPFLTQISLRGDGSKRAFSDAVKKATGAALPKVACSVSQAGSVRILWLSPDEWLVTAPDAERVALVQSLQTALAKQHASVVDLSANRTVIELIGPDARGTLEKACLHDLHPRAFLVDRVVGTVLAKTQVFMERASDDPDTWRLYVRNSFARHLADWLMDAMVEFTQPKA